MEQQCGSNSSMTAKKRVMTDLVLRSRLVELLALFVDCEVREMHFSVCDVFSGRRNVWSGAQSCKPIVVHVDY